MNAQNTSPTKTARWYALRDLKRPNALQRAWEMFEEMKMDIFTPKRWTLSTVKGKRQPKEVALIPDLLFVHDTRQNLDPIIANTDTLQYRFRKYGAQNEPIIVPDKDMDRFIRAVRSSEQPVYYLPEEITPQMYGKAIHIVGGLLDGYEGRLLKMRGSKVKRLLVELDGFLVAAVEVNPEYIRLR